MVAAKRHAKATCAECKGQMFATDGIMPDHDYPRTKERCVGSGELCLEAEEPELLQGELEAQDEPEREATHSGNGAAVEVKIEKGVPIPIVKRGKKSRFKGALQAMEIGDSFAYPDDEKRAVEAAVRDAAKKLDIKITIRRTGEAEVRIWRIK